MENSHTLIESSDTRADAFGGRIKLDNWKRSENIKRYIDALQEKALRENYDTKLILVKQGGKSKEICKTHMSKLTRNSLCLKLPLLLTKYWWK